uniref:NADH-ubiquinone oxidoreductase chain 6 n=1 Tax=Tenuibranchiurus glypticus TaxID=99779 RepID=A0A0A0QYS5_9EUCA|nr:NADH dehydrogenase subunit 6 [Tenuibranchiurus glypticus]AIU94542.1 NADH dehydrogenase subunit 6 [Tenuibranchiurus glypticus]
MSVMILYLFLPLILSLSILFSQLTHPLSMGLTLLTQTVLICLFTGTFNPSFWFSYILFLIFLGGMLILFIYVASLASNEVFQVNSPLSILPLIFMSTIFPFLILDPLTLKQQFFYLSSESFFMNKMTPTLHTTNMIYAPPSWPLTIFMILYLLFALLAVAKIITTPSSPLRPSNLT